MRISDWSSDVCSSDLLPRAPALVRLGHAAACLVGGVAGAVAAPLRRLDRLGAPDSAALAGLAGGAAWGLRLPPAQSLWRTRTRRRACRVLANLLAICVAGRRHDLAEPGAGRPVMPCS